tara:strand:+ start:179 stop:508 length:330 start_codon:yes stop_codon:yes gene_type:complete
MKRIYLILCILGTVLPYYNLIQFLINSKGSMQGFFTPLFATFPTAMISWDITIAGTTFLIFLIHQSQKKRLKITKYVIALFMVGFSLALPLFLYNHFNSSNSSTAMLSQ